jgi:hypothetical protein
MLAADGRECRRIANNGEGRRFRESFGGRHLSYICNPHTVAVVIVAAAAGPASSVRRV